MHGLIDAVVTRVPLVPPADAFPPIADCSRPHELGTSGHTTSDFAVDRGVNARARDYLEVADVGTEWVSPGNDGRLPAVHRGRTSDFAQELDSVPRRARMWKFSLPLRHPETGRLFADLDHLGTGLQRRSIDRYLWLIHDRDEGSAPHVQGALKLGNSRSRDQLATMLGLPVTALRPLRDRSGQHGAFERYCRYLLHESPEAQADGKFHYPDSAVHASFDFRDMIDQYFGYTSEGSSRSPLSADQIRLKVYRGEMSPAEVSELHPMVFIRNYKSLEDLYFKGRQDRVVRAALAERAVGECEASRTQRSDLQSV